MIVFAFIVVIAIIVTIGNMVRNRRSPTPEEYQRAQEPLRNYEKQQRSYDDYQVRANQYMDRQEALFDRIERLVDRLEEKYRTEPGSASDGAGDTRFRQL